MSLLPHLTYETHNNPDSAVIWLHGLGANGHDFYPVVPELGLPKSIKTRFIFPHAPSIPVTINNGYVMPAWYDITEMAIDRKIDEVQLRKSADALEAFIDDQNNKGIVSERIIVAGFSQGGAVALESFCRYPHKLAGLLAMSTYFATSNSVNWQDVNKSSPIEVHHGTADPVVPEALGQNIYSQLTNQGFAPNYRRYPMQHAVCPQQIADISQFFNKVLG